MISRVSSISASLVLLFFAGSGSLAEEPVSSTAAPAPAPEAVLADLPFEPYPEPNRVIVDLAPEGHKPFPLMLDTGAAESVLTPRLARSLGVSVRRTKSSPYRRPTILGRDLQFWVNTRRGDTASNVAFEYGLLGSDFLDDYILEIDFPARRVRFLDPKRYEIPKEVSAEDEGLLPIRRIGTRIGADIEINGRSGMALLDTGAPGTVLLSGKLARKLDIDVEALAKQGHVQGTRGPVAVRSYETDSFRIAGFAFDEMPMLVAPKGFYNIGGPTDSLVGYDVFSQFVLRIDFEGQRIWLKRTGSDRVTIYGADYQLLKQIGAKVMPTETGFSVSTVNPEGAAANFGLRDGDHIVVPHGDPTISIDTVLRRVEAGEALTVARLEGDIWVDTILPDPAHLPLSEEPDEDLSEP